MLLETLLGKQKSEPSLMMTLLSASFLKGFKRLEDQCMIKRIEIISKTLGKWSTLKTQEKKRSLDASREQEQREEGMWLNRMGDLSTGKEKHTQPQHQMAKIQTTTEIPKALSQKATVKERAKTSESCWLEER